MYANTLPLRLMKRFSEPKALSVLYSIHEQFEGMGDWEAPEPNFWKWFEKIGFVDVAECHDNVIWDKLDDSERRAWQLFADAIEATTSLLELHQDHGELFLKVARRLSFLPTFLSWHPDCENFNRQLLAKSELGTCGIHRELRRHPYHLRHQSWPTRYAYAIASRIRAGPQKRRKHLQRFAALRSGAQKFEKNTAVHIASCPAGRSIFEC